MPRDSMNLPLPPTDNLYKFVALSGTILFILGLYAPLYLDEQFHDKLLDYDLKVAKYEADAEYYDREMKFATADSSDPKRTEVSRAT